MIGNLLGKNQNNNLDRIEEENRLAIEEELYDNEIEGEDDITRAELEI